MIDLKDYIVESLLDNKLLKPLRDFIQRNFKKRVGFKEMITVCIQGDKYEFTATIDTGNGGVVPTLGVDKMDIDGDKITITIGDKEYTFDKKGEASPTVGNVVHHRPIIIIDYIKIGGRKLDEPFIAVTDERKKSTKTLINRDTMSKLNLVVDPSKNNLIHEKLRINNDTKLGNRVLDDCEEWCEYFKRNGCEVLESKKWMYVIYLKKGTSPVDNEDKHINFEEDDFTYPFIHILNEKSYWNPWRWTEKCITIYNDKSSKEKLPIDDFDVVWDEMEPDHIRGLAFSTKNADIIIDELNKYYEKSK